MRVRPAPTAPPPKRRSHRTCRNWIRSRWRHLLWRVGLYPDVALLDDGRIVVSGWCRWPKPWRYITKNDPCVYCNGKAETLDHVVPIAEGGKGGTNLVPACALCNGTKASAPLLQFLIKLRRTMHANRRWEKRGAKSLTEKQRQRRIVQQWKRARPLTASIGDRLRRALDS